MLRLASFHGWPERSFVGPKGGGDANDHPRPGGGKRPGRHAVEVYLRGWHGRFLRSWFVIAFGHWRISLMFCLSAVLLVLCLLLGGATRTGFLSDFLLQLISVPVLAVTIWHLSGTEQPRHARWALAFCAALLALPLLQLIPLPPAIWMALPGRGLLHAAFEIAGTRQDWHPMTVAPRGTWLSLLSLLPAIAIFLCSVQLSYRERRLLTIVLLGVGLLGVSVGLVQVAQGPSSPLRFFEITNPTEAVGFFANRNHFAALLYALTVFAGAWTVNAARVLGAEHRRSRRGAFDDAVLIAAFTALVILVAAQAMARSRAGLALTIVALLGPLALAFSDPRGGTRGAAASARLLVAATMVAIVFAAQFALYRILERFTSDPLEDARLQFARGTIQAAKAYMPFGSGLGSFVPIYALFETPQALLPNAYANRAHNDVLELWLEGGLASAGLMAAFVIWLALRCAHVWRRAPTGARHVDHLLARAASIVLALLIAHSFADYPLRTAAMMAVTAVACALLIEPSHSAISDGVSEPWSEPGMSFRTTAATAGSAQSHRSPASAQESVSTPTFASTDPPSLAHGPRRQPIELWGDGIEWPEEWRKPADAQPSSAPRAPGKAERK